METTVDTLYEVAAMAARVLVRQHHLPQHLVEDFTQDGVLYLLEHPKIVANAVSPDGTYFPATLTARLKREIGKRAKKEVEALQVGPPEPLYSPKVIGVAIPAYWDPDYEPPRADSSDRIKSGKDPAENGTWMAVVADVKRAVDWYGPTERQITLLFKHYLLNESWDDIALDMGEPRSTVHARAQRALKEMADWLNYGEEEEDVPA